MASSTTTFHLIGQGSISCLLAAHFCHDNITFKQYARTPANKTVKHLSYGMLHLPPARQLNHSVDLQGIVILPLKAFVIADVLQQLQNSISEDSAIVLMHNGMGTIELAVALFPNHHIIAATTSMAGFTQDSVVKHTGFGNTFYGTVHPGKQSQQQRNAHLNQLALGLADAKQTDNIRVMLWTKLAVNAVINPLTAIHDVQNGELIAPSYVKLTNEILREILTLAKAKDIPLDHSTVLNTVNTVIYDTQDNLSSMQQDIEHGRRTEIDFINGFIVQEAEKVGIQVPTNKSLWQHVHKLEGRL